MTTRRQKERDAAKRTALFRKVGAHAEPELPDVPDYCQRREIGSPRVNQQTYQPRRRRSIREPGAKVASTTFAVLSFSLTSDPLMQRINRYRPTPVQKSAR